MLTTDNVETTLKCPKCGFENKKTLGWLQHNNKFTCADCPEIITLEQRQASREIGKVNDMLAEIKKGLLNLGK